MCLYGDTSLFYFWISKLWFSSMGFCKGLMDPLGVAVLVLTWSIKVQVEPILDRSFKVQVDPIFGSGSSLMFLTWSIKDWVQI